MIFDKLNNISLYKNIPGLVIDFVNNLDSEIELGKHILSDEIYVNVETYSTRTLNNARFESHQNYIDIQILLQGEELIYTAESDKLNVESPYNPEKDITFYSDNLNKRHNFKLDGSNFVMLYPHEAHAPQVAINDESKNVLKVVVKIKCK